MKLISCDNCGVMLDGDKLTFPWVIYKEDGSIDDSKAVWINREYVPCVPCPVCGDPIAQEKETER